VVVVVEQEHPTRKTTRTHIHALRTTHTLANVLIVIVVVVFVVVVVVDQKQQ
jgi:hypothetical protein